MSDLTRDSARQVLHAALLYASADEFAAGALNFVDAGLDEDAAVLVSVPGPQLGFLRARMNGRSRRVSWADITRVGANPARIIPFMDDFASAHDGRPVRCLQGLAWTACSVAEQGEAVRHEALINVAFAAAQVRILCTYDSSRLDPRVIRSARRTHPLLIGAGHAGPSPAYSSGVIPGEYDRPLPDPPERAATLVYRTDLASARAYAARCAGSIGLPSQRVPDLVLAVGELVANTFRHTGADGVLSIWSADNELVCQVQDAGHITDPLAGRRRPGAQAGGGQGLWVVHQVCDLVEVRSGAGGTVIRLHMHLDS